MISIFSITKLSKIVKLSKTGDVIKKKKENDAYNEQNGHFQITLNYHFGLAYKRLNTIHWTSVSRKIYRNMKRLKTTIKIIVNII